MIRKVISGGQTGADQAGLDAAISAGIEHGGFVPKGRLTENGRLSDRYRVEEAPSEDYRDRTLMNVLAADGTLILAHGRLTGGSRLTRQYARAHGKPCLFVNLNTLGPGKAAKKVERWIQENGIEVLNVAGPRSSKDSGIYEAVYGILQRVFHLKLPGAKRRRVIR